MYIDSSCYTSLKQLDEAVKTNLRIVDVVTRLMVIHKIRYPRARQKLIDEPIRFKITFLEFGVKLIHPFS